MFAVTAFSMAVISYALHNDLDTRVAETAVDFAFMTLIAITGSYVFAATWEDVSTFRNGATRTTITAETVEPSQPVDVEK
jgi:hypothetical protein